MSMQLVYKDIAVGADADAAVTAPDALSICTPAQLAFGADVPRIATCERDMWALDGSFELHSAQVIPYWSTAISGADGAFESPPAVTVAFDSQYTSLGISFRFSPNTGDYCNELTITWYRGDTQLDQKTFTPSGVSYFCAETVTAYNKVVIAFGKTNKPYRRARLEQITFGVLRDFYADELSGVKILQEVNLISAEVAINTLTWKLYSTADVEYLFQLKQPVEAYSNGGLIGIFYISGSKRSTARIYEISCQDAIGVLDGYDFPAKVYSSYSAVTLINDIVGGAFELNIDSGFSTATVTGYLPAGTRRAALQQVLFAIGAACDTSGARTIRVFTPPSAYAEIPDDRIYSGGAMDASAIVTAVRVTAHTYTAGSGANGDDVIDVGGTKYVHTTAVTTISNPIVTATDKQNIVEVKDATLVGTANVAAVAQRVYDYYTRRQTLSTKIINAGEKPGDAVTISTPWDKAVSGNITSMTTVLSTTTASDIKVR